jgi:Histidine kinase-, DNA gyrase B-, and HSP90-like ATPase/Topoisomerase 6 subunit A/Spo11, Toprim domain
MSTALLNRTTFETSRDSEYFELRQLQAQTGQPADMFAAVAFKELLDNALDACETAGIAPRIGIDLYEQEDRLTISIQDNGSGIPPETVRRILNFQTRTSDKAAYRSPTRGAQGNALKTVLGMPCAFGMREPVLIEACGVAHRILAWLDPVGEVRIDYQDLPIPVTRGTCIQVTLPARSWRFDPVWWRQGVALFNPHASVKIRRAIDPSEHGEYDLRVPLNFYQSSEMLVVDKWRKWMPTDPTSAWWYTATDLKRLIFSHIAEWRRGGPDLLLRDFVRQFKHLSATARAKAVCAQLPTVKYLSDFEHQEAEIARLLSAMRDAGEAPEPEVLGCAGADAFKSRWDRWYGVERSWYKKASGEVDGIPFVIEVAVAATAVDGSVWTGVNFSPTFEDPFANTYFRAPKFSANGLKNFFEQAHITPWLPGDTPRQRTAVAVHLICPSLEFLDRGKTRLKVPRAISDVMTKALWSVTKTLYEEEEQRRKDGARAERQARERQITARRKQWRMNEAVFQVMHEAWQHASGDGAYPLSARFLYYAVRKLIQQYTDKELDYSYFSQDLLTEYQRHHGRLRGLYYDPRGVLYEPHTGNAIPLGTREVESYTFPAWLYDKILYMEKKGVWPIFQAAQLAEFYDMAIVAAEGYANEAVRTLFEHADQDRNYQLFVLHDADPDGYNIARTLREATERMPDYSVEVIDLGLHLEDALALGLATEEFTRLKRLPEGLVLNEVERQYFEGREVWRDEYTNKRSWRCERVELNAFTAPDLVDYVKQKLEEAGVRGKVIPPQDVIVHHAREVYEEEIDVLVDRVLGELIPIDQIKRAMAEQFHERIPWDETQGWVETSLEDTPTHSWRRALERAVQESVEAFTDEAETAIRTRLQTEMGHE